uniref:Small ribosomal subunit protein uS19c n=1 Tax=Jakoba bahamiensis TaxID=221721 RepID=M4QD98_9EUKA|nr:ribosomal protein S19 [Jakoba bahamiensis]AGH24155.1 ribosomal protein S19 [Jakoba bahamiensis]
MSRSIWKGPYVEKHLLKKIALLSTNFNNNMSKPIRTWSRQSVILPEFLGYMFQIYNGCKWISVRITEEMVGHKLGEFAITRKPCVHKKKKKK